MRISETGNNGPAFALCVCAAQSALSVAGLLLFAVTSAFWQWRVGWDVTKVKLGKVVCGARLVSVLRRPRHHPPFSDVPAILPRNGSHTQ